MLANKLVNADMNAIKYPVLLVMIEKPVTYKKELNQQEKNYTAKEATDMKTLLILTAILFSFIIESAAQRNDIYRDKPPGAIYLAYQPTDHGLGIRGDYHFNYWAGIYGSGSYGEWRIYKDSGLDQHVKLTFGVLIPYKDYMSNQNDFTLGINYHWVSGEIVDSNIYRDHSRFHQPWSFELGLTIKTKYFAIGVRTDILRWEPCIDIGIPIKTKHSYHKR